MKNLYSGFLWHILHVCLGGTFVMLVACSDATEPTNETAETQKNNISEQNEPEATEADVTKAIDKSKFKSIEWEDLMPKGDFDALTNPPEYIINVEGGSFEDKIASNIKNKKLTAKQDRYQQALTSTKIIEEMKGQAVRIPGFIVPLEFNDTQVVKQFFIVPYFGACIHMPPPPPNQIIFVDYPKGLKLGTLYDVFWIYGVMDTSLTENDMGTSAYSIKMEYYEPYVETYGQPQPLDDSIN